VLDVHIYSQGSDALTVNGTATLGGTLNVLLGPGYYPQPGNYGVVGYGSRSGTFGTVHVPPQGNWQVRYDDPLWPNPVSVWESM
jgi:hypothetical protein